MKRDFIMLCNIKKKFIFLLLLLLLIIIIGRIPAEAKEKFNGSYLTNFHLYQIGTYEFVMKLYGKHLPVAEPNFYENTMQLILENTRVKNVHAMKLLTENLEHSVPLINDLDIQNLPDDEVSILITSSSPMTLKSGKQNFDGLTLHIKIQEEEQQDKNFLMNNISVNPVKKFPTSPQNSVWFIADEKVTIELRDADLRDVLRLLMEQCGRNTIIDNSFPSNILITMSLKNTRIDEVLNYLLRTYDLACYRAGANIVAFGLKDSLYKLSGEKEIKSFRIAHGDLAAAVTMLKSLTGLQDNEITTDERMRTLHINTNPAKMLEVIKAISKIDVPSKQVMIYASIFEFSDAATKDVQHSLELVYDKWQMNLNLGQGENLLIYNDDTYRNGKSNFDRYITATLHGLETKNKGKTIANPSVIAIDGQEASVSLKQEILYRKGLNDKGGVEWGSEEVGPELKFKPQIENNGYINLEITINTGDYLGADTEGNIRTTTREVKTKIRVRNGMPFVIGGLNQDTDVRIRNKIPILGNIPLLGELFSYSSREKNKSQAVMIVTPYIIESR